MGSMRAAYLVALWGLALVACGGDESESATPPPATAAGASGVATTAASADRATGSTANAVSAPAATDDPESSSLATVPPGTGGGACSVTITGAVSAEWTSTASGFQAFVYGGWLANPSPDDASAFGVNCFDSGFNIVGFSASPGTEIPMEPATYVFPESFDPSAPINAEVALLFDEGLWETTGGTLDIVEFDDARIRGRFALQIQGSFDTTRNAELSGEFEHSR